MPGSSGGDATLKVENEKLVKELAIVKKQADQTHDAYMKLTGIQFSYITNILDEFNLLSGAEGGNKKRD